MAVYDEFIGGVQAAGLQNPYGLAAVAATGKRESGYKPSNAFGAWSDPAESGGAGTAGGIMSWRNERLDKMRQFALDAGDNPAAPSPATQAQFFAQEDPALIERLNQAKSVEEAQGLMNRAWRFAGYDRPGGEAAARTETAKAYFNDMGGSSVPDSFNTQGSTMAYGNPTTPPMGQFGMPEQPEPSGLGGIGGFLKDPGVSDMIRAMGMSLMSSPSNNPLQGFSSNYTALTDRREKADERDLQTQAMMGALKQAGFTDEQAAMYARSPEAANVAVAAQTSRTKETQLLSTQNRTADYAEQQGYPDIAEAIRSNMIDGATGFKEMQARQKAATGGGGEFGLQPVPILNPDGTYGVAQLGKDGTVNLPRFPEGVRPYNPEELTQSKARGTAFGKVSGEAAGALPGATGMADRVSAQIESLKNDEYLPSMVGPIDSRLGNWSGDAARVQSKMDQLRGGTFLQAREMLKGGGAITDFEGKKAEDAFARLNAAQSEKDYIDALNDFNDAVRDGVTKLQQSAEGGAVVGPQRGGGQSDYRNRYGLE
jgi:hypothetical protein